MANGAGSDIVGHFRAGLDVLKQYPVMVLPPLVVQVIVAVLTALFVGSAVTAVVIGGGAGLVGAFFGGFFFVLLVGVLSLIASAVTVVMARDALGAREPSIGDALAVVLGRLVDVLVASVVVMVVVGIGMLLLVLPGVVAAFFLIFTLPAVLLDSRSGLDAIKRSVTLVKDNLVEVVLFVIGCLLVGVAFAIVSAVLGRIPLLGHLVTGVAAGIAIAYVSIVAVRVYQTLPRR
jgi:hypothetical protein